MKRFFRWIFYVLAGAALGYIAGLFIGLNVYLLMGLGILLGSSAAITVNIQESKDESLYRAIDKEYWEEPEEIEAEADSESERTSTPESS